MPRTGWVGILRAASPVLFVGVIGACEPNTEPADKPHAFVSPDAGRRDAGVRRIEEQGAVVDPLLAPDGLDEIEHGEVDAVEEEEERSSPARPASTQPRRERRTRIPDTHEWEVVSPDGDYDCTC